MLRGYSKLVVLLHWSLAGADDQRWTVRESSRSQSIACGDDRFPLFEYEDLPPGPGPWDWAKRVLLTLRTSLVRVIGVGTALTDSDEDSGVKTGPQQGDTPRRQ